MTVCANLIASMLFSCVKRKYEAKVHVKWNKKCDCKGAFEAFNWHDWPTNKLGASEDALLGSAHLTLEPLFNWPHSSSTRPFRHTQIVFTYSDDIHKWLHRPLRRVACECREPCHSQDRRQISAHIAMHGECAISGNEDAGEFSILIIFEFCIFCYYPLRANGV